MKIKSLLRPMLGAAAVSHIVLVLALASTPAFAGKTGEGDENGAGRSAAPRQVTSIPSTVSEEAAASFAFYTDYGQKFMQNFPEPDDLEGWTRKNEEECQGMADYNAKVKGDFEPSIEEGFVDGIRVLDIKPKDWVDNDRAVVFFTGGAYTLYPADHYLTGPVALAGTSGLRVFSVDYSLAPHAKFFQILEEAKTVIKGLSTKGFAGKLYSMDQLALVGDSAGGGLVAGTILMMRDAEEELPMPCAIALWSPWCDLTCVGDTYDQEDRDPAVSGEALKACALAYAPVDEHKNPYVSPVYGDFSKEKGDHPPVLIQWGTKEIMGSDSVRYGRALRRAKQPVIMSPYEGMEHTFQTIAWDRPESKEALEETADFLKGHMGIE